MSFRGGRESRERPWKEYPLRSEEKSNHGRSGAAPSRHLWVGNLSHTLTERALSNHFRQFGELESVAFQPGRSYAFINFIDVGAALAAFGALQGFILAGNALRIEFTKAEKSSAALSLDEDYLHRRDELRRGSPFPQRDSNFNSNSRVRHSNSDPIYLNENPKSNSKDKDATEPSEVLWVGFPQSLKVDQESFRKAFSPFGEIEKISAYPGRTYAFIRFKHVNSACRAKESLQGKLFGNPRVHITFARSESGGPSNSRNDHPPPSPSPRPRSYTRYHDRRSPRDLDDSIDFNRNGNRLIEQRFERNYGRRSPSRGRFGNLHEFPPHRLYDDDEWDLPEDALLYHGGKKLRTTMIPPESELPEYPFSDSDHLIPRPHEFDRHFGYHNQISDFHVNQINAQNTLHNASYDAFHAGPMPFPQNAIEWNRATPEPQSEEWKWEGIIAKGGTSICRARCFPVGKVLDMILPEFLDCTARTSLDMLAKHYYQAASSWVVFFVPESDADMAFYNEFMNYLGEKQRAAVAKLDEKTTLFLVPPSDFSEKILKVPGKLSISGVILRLEQPSTTVEPLPPPPPPQRLPESSRTSFASPSGPYQPGLANVGKPRPSTSTSTYDYMAAPHNQETNINNYRPGSPMMSQYGHQEPKVLPIQQDQLAQLASFLGSSRDEFRQQQPSINTMMMQDNVFRMQQPQTQTQTAPSPSQQTSQYQYQHQQQPQGLNMGGQSSSQGGEEADADPQKRLQATLELAATLLKQIQQGKT